MIAISIEIQRIPAELPIKHNRQEKDLDGALEDQIIKDVPGEKGFSKLIRTSM